MKVVSLSRGVTPLVRVDPPFLSSFKLIGGVN